MSENLVSQITRDSYRVMYDSVDIGYCDDVDATQLKLMLEAITAGTVGKAMLGMRFVGMEGLVKVRVKEVNLTNIATLMPWSGSGPYVFTPPLNTDMYTYAQELRLHPNSIASGTTTSDLVLAKVVPISPYNVKKTGKEDFYWDCEFQIYPDRSQLVADPPVLYYGGVGAT